VTLVEEAGAQCWGMVYRVEPDHVDEVLAALDCREKGGYRREELEVVGQGGSAPALTYLATPDNPNYLGPAPIDALAAQIHGAVGPSGANEEYVLRLDEALREMGARDPHVGAVARAVRRIRTGR
jgi:cation transport regulator ChaC